jgi:hypothetical protein
MIACRGDMIQAITLKKFCPVRLKQNPTIETIRIVIMDGNSTANDWDTFGGTLSGREIFSLPESTSLTYSSVQEVQPACLRTVR